MSVSTSAINAVPSYPPNGFSLPEISHRSGRYELRIVRSGAELQRVQELRFEVFNLELGEGLSSSYALQRDEDEFDAYCHHLIVEDKRHGVVVGTYRLMTLEMSAVPGFYSANEFRLDGLPNELTEQAVELGRACVAKAHRNSRVLFLLWYGLAQYLRETSRRYFFGCCSLTSQDPNLGIAAAQHILEKGYAHESLNLVAQPAYRCVRNGAAIAADSVSLPRLMRMYIQYGAHIISEPALDREFGTIDYLALFDVRTLDSKSRRLFGLNG